MEDLKAKSLEKEAKIVLGFSPKIPHTKLSTNDKKLENYI
jgi:arginine utilization protein RocB